MDDFDKIIEGAIALGFVVSDHDELKCTHEQLILFSAIIAQEAIRQALGEQSNAQS